MSVQGIQALFVIDNALSDDIMIALSTNNNHNEGTKGI